jgi:hypothetical protein
MDIFLDTETINRQYFLDRPPISLLIEEASVAGHNVFLPEIVIRELVTHFREDLESAVRDASRISATLTRLTGGQRPLVLDLSSSDEYVVSYERWLREYLNENGCMTPGFPPGLRDVSLLVDRDLKRRRPFQDSGKGMRDAVLWETILEHLRTSRSGQVAVVTGNVADFCDGRRAGALHPHLLHDLDAAGIPRNRVLHFSSIADVLSAHVAPASARIERLRAALEVGAPDVVDLYEWIEEQAEEVLADGALEDGLRYSLPDYRDVELREITEVFDLQLETLLPAGPAEGEDALYAEGRADLVGVATVTGSREALTGVSRDTWLDDESVTGRIGFRAVARFSATISGVTRRMASSTFQLSEVRARGHLDVGW